MKPQWTASQKLALLLQYWKREDIFCPICDGDLLTGDRGVFNTTIWCPVCKCGVSQMPKGEAFVYDKPERKEGQQS